MLVHHRRLNAWVPPGGHVDPGELPHQTAAREVLEETGVAIEVLQTDPGFENEDPQAFLPPQPLFVQCVTAKEDGLLNYHFDLVYLCRPQKKTLSARSGPDDEVLCARWVRVDQLHTLALATNVRSSIELAMKKIERL